MKSHSLKRGWHLGISGIVTIFVIAASTFLVGQIRTGTKGKIRPGDLGVKQEQRTEQQKPRTDNVYEPSAPQASFTNSSPIAINDESTASPYPTAITVSGLSGTIPSTTSGVSVTLNGFSHTFPDDVGIVLVGPTGAALLLQDGCGDDPDMNNVTYTISDAGSTRMPDLTAWVAGTYLPTSYFSGDIFPGPGPGSTYNNPGPAGAGTATFSSTFGGTNPNGTWNLYVVDFTAGDSGAISGGWTLNIGLSGITHTQHVVDFDGDGKTDYTVVRNIGAGTSGAADQMRWFTKTAGSGAVSGLDWGVSTDRFTPADFDGDGKTDYAIWRAGTGASALSYFYIINSATNTVRIEQFGLVGDNPSVVGDYDGDHKADPAVFRTPGTPGQTFFFYRASLNNPNQNVTYVPWGSTANGSVFPSPGDFDGDGKFDFCVQRANPAQTSQGQFVLLRSSDLGYEFINWGLPTDVIESGDFDGDGKADFCVLRASGGLLQHWLLTRAGATSMTTWGASATDFIVPGDYDGDGKTDFAIFRPSTTAGATAFWILNSGTGAASIAPWGQNGDFPVANGLGAH